MKFSLVFVLSIVIWILLIFIIYDKFHTPSAPTINQSKIVLPVEQSVVVKRENSNDQSAEIKQENSNLVKGAVLTSPEKIQSITKKASESKAIDKPPAAIVQRDVVKTAKSYKVGGNKGIAWNEFLKLDREVPGNELAVVVPEGVYFNTCSNEVVGNITEPGLSKENYEWCKWTLSPTGGNVKVRQLLNLHNIAIYCIELTGW
jgi:hypothetical protein